jgi:hypothetical protein
VGGNPVLEYEGDLLSSHGGRFFMTAQWCFVYLAKIAVAVFLGIGPKIIH